VIGIHVRAGNGEGGDFERKGRSISNPDVWVQNIRTLIQESLLLSTQNNNNNNNLSSSPPVLYIATDTPSMVIRFRQQFESINIQVLDLPQQGRAEEGNGVLFGESDKVHNKGNGRDSDNDDDHSSCLQGWSDTITDMMVLSHADVVIAAKPSSFVQTLPMSLAFGRDKFDRKLSNVYCEIIPQFEQAANNMEWMETSPTIQCYDSYHDWCCNYNTWIKFHVSGPNGRQKVVSKEFVKFPPIENDILPKEYKSMRNRTKNCMRPRRGRAGGGWKDKCLPHFWRPTTLD
jgi:hypothetical protein